MTETTTKVEQAAAEAARQYFRLVILAGAPASGKTAVLQSVAHKLGCPLVNVSLELRKRCSN
jgi:chloramphenicol 3-O-phosphotransferase